MQPLVHSRCASCGQRGLSVVELLVGVAIGLFVLGGAGKLFVDYLIDNRRVLLETRLNQDLRVGSDLIVRELRRATYWGNAGLGVIGPAASAVTPNPHATIVVTNNDLTVGELRFSYGHAPINNIEDPAERSGFKVSGGALWLLNGGGGWQAVTDTESLFIDTATLAPTAREVELFGTCPCLASGGCTAPSFLPVGANYATRPRLVIREYSLTLAGYAPTDPTRVRREVRENVRVRNDQITGACPAP